ncbi:MAG: Ldh family oxidoreductase [Hyphomicrobiaceae bacterium]
MTTLSLPDLEALISAALVASNVSPANGASVARALSAAEADGQKGHGLSRVPSYAAQARSGKVDGHAKPDAKQSRPASIIIDARHGFSYPAIDIAVDVLPALARANGIAAAAVTRSHHFGVAAHPCERLAAGGLVALAFGNTPSAMSPWGGRRALFGTNPIAFAAPCSGRPAVVVDLALSEVARGRIMTAALQKKTIPLGWALDVSGQPTTNAEAALKGTLLPSGGAKGAALALMVEVLAAALTGSNFAFEATSFFEADGAPPSVGQFLLAIDPGAFAGETSLPERISLLAQAIEHEAGARVPGKRRFDLRDQAAAHGVDVDAALLADVQDIAHHG